MCLIVVSLSHCFSLDMFKNWLILPYSLWDPLILPHQKVGMGEGMSVSQDTASHTLTEHGSCWGSYWSIFKLGQKCQRGKTPGPLPALPIWLLRKMLLRTNFHFTENSHPRADKEAWNTVKGEIAFHWKRGWQSFNPNPTPDLLFRSRVQLD